MLKARPNIIAATALMSVVALVGGAISTTAPAQAASAPSGLRATFVAARGVGLTWNGSSNGAYRVSFSTSSSASAKSWAFEGNYFEWTRTDANPSLSAARLTPGGTYYFRVKALNSARQDLTGYSSPLAVTLPTNAKPELPPVDLKATTGDANSVHLSWRTRGSGVRYELRYRTDSGGWSSAGFASAGGLLSGLEANTNYSFQVRVLSPSGVALSEYSASVPKRTATGSPSIVVASYNITKTGSGPAWSGRRTAVAANILAQKPGVVMLQEAVPPKVTVNGKKIPQYTDILNLLGSKYTYVTSEASSGTRLAYDSTRFKVLTADAVKLYKYGKQPRYAVWAILRDK